MTTLTYTGKLTVTDCASCYMRFAMPGELIAELRRNHKTFYCPLGHRMGFTGRSDEEELRDQLATQKRRTERFNAALTATRDQLHATERSLRGHKAAKTRIKNRIAAGVCPCCNRQFQNLHRHMTGQHPDFPTTD